jgi:5-hydroxyisourate hydrolase
MPINVTVVDWTIARAAEGVAVRMELQDNDGWLNLTTGSTDETGTLSVQEAVLIRGIYRLELDTGAYFSSLGIQSFYPRATVTIRVTDPDDTYLVQVLITPYAQLTYRGPSDH